LTLAKPASAREDNCDGKVFGFVARASLLFVDSQHRVQACLVSPILWNTYGQISMVSFD
jgi:hypothetical protein